MQYLTRSFPRFFRTGYANSQFGRRLVVFAAAMALLTGAGIIGAPQSKAATVTLYAHQCNLVDKDDGTTQGVFCVDLEGWRNSAGDYNVELRVEAVCQLDAYLPSSVPTQCANVSLPHGQWNIYAGNGWSTLGDATDGCGHGQIYHPSCSANGRNIFGPIEDGRGAFLTIPPGSCWNVWAVIFANEDSIQLPHSGETGVLLGNLSTGHVDISGNGGTCS